MLTNACKVFQLLKPTKIKNKRLQNINKYYNSNKSTKVTLTCTFHVKHLETSNHPSFWLFFIFCIKG